MIFDVTQVVQAGIRQERKMETIINHLANVSTTGFKADILSFDQMLQANMTIDFSQGDLIQTGNSLDLALNGDGFFKIQTPGGIRYTRNGTFTLNNEKSLVTQNGDPVLGSNGPITIEGGRIEINDAGEIWVEDETTGTMEMVGKPAIVDFAQKDRFTKEGESLFIYNGSPADETVLESTTVKQGELEMPNVSTVVEMTKMMECMRGYESCMKTLQALDETDSKAINELGKV
jgi:flagellar basal-body rod protein FlgF